MSGALAFLVATVLEQAARQERVTGRQVAADAELLLRWLRSRPTPPTLKEVAQRCPLRDKARRAKALTRLLRDGRCRRELRSRSTVLVPS